MVAQRDKQDISMSGCIGNMSDYPTWLRRRLKKEMDIIPLAQLINEYEKKTHRKLSPSGYVKTFKRIAKNHYFRKEQLYWSPTEVSMSGCIGQALHRYQSDIHNQSNRTHSSHNYRFSIAYAGEQPLDGQVLAFGNPKSKVRQVQVWFEFRQPNALKRIIAFKNRLVIMLAGPKGETTQEQIIEARSQSYKAIATFAKKRNLVLGKEFEKTLVSHHVLELGNADAPRTSTNLNGYIKDAIAEAEKEVYDIVGSRFDSSHRGRLEHDNISKNYACTPEQRAKNMEWLLAAFREDFSKVAYIQLEAAKDQAHLSENHRSHVAAVQALAAGIEKQNILFERMVKALEGLKT
jgi:hypothetical protein